MTQELIKEYFRYQDGELYWIKRPAKANRLDMSKPAGVLTPKGRVIAFQGKRYYASRLIWNYFHKNLLPGLVVCHLDKDPFNNRIENLDELSQKQKCMIL